MKKGIVIILTLTIVLLMSVAAYASNPSCISGFHVASGSNAMDQLEESGYNVIYQNLNPAGGSRVYLGYTLGGRVVTGLMTFPEYQNSIESGGVTYTPVSQTSLNSGAAGSPLYLYYTTDAAAGDGIVSLTFVRDTSGEEYGPLDYLNDGSIPVRNEDGTPADFENGVSGYDLYCFMVRESVCLPYVSELKTVDVFSGEDLFSQLTASGCNYYEEQPIASGYGVTTYLCYNRTADASKAIRQVFAANAEESWDCDFVSAGSYQSGAREFTLWYTTEESAGEPAAEISCGKRMADVFTRGDWAMAFFEGRATGARTQLYNESAYENLAASEEPYDQYPVLAYAVGEDGTKTGETGLYLIRSTRGVEPYEPTFAPAEALSEPAEEPVEEPAEEPVEEPAEEPVEVPVEVPAEVPVEEPAEEPVEVPVEEPAEVPVEEPAEVPVEEPAEVPVEEPVEVPVEEPVETLIAVSEAEQEVWCGIKLPVPGDAEDPAWFVWRNAEGAACPEVDFTYGGIRYACRAEQTADSEPYDVFQYDFNWDRLYSDTVNGIAFACAGCSDVCWCAWLDPVFGVAYTLSGPDEEISFLAEQLAFGDRSEDVSGSIYEIDGTLRDTEAEGIEKNEPEDAAEVSEDVNAGSAIGVGSMIAIVVMIFIAAVVVFLFVRLRNRKPEGQEQW